MNKYSNPDLKLSLEFSPSWRVTTFDSCKNENLKKRLQSYNGEFPKNDEDILVAFYAFVRIKGSPNLISASIDLWMVNYSKKFILYDYIVKTNENNGYNFQFSIFGSIY